MIRDILAIIDDAAAATPFIDQALAFASAHDASLRIAVLTPNPYVAPELLPLGGFYLPEEELAREDREKVAEVQALVTAAGARVSVFGLHGEVAWLAVDMRRSWHLADLILVGSTEAWKTEWLRRRVLESCILASGTPTMILPAGAAVSPAKQIVLGWKPSPEATRALHDLVAVADADATVHVVIANQDASADAGEEVCRHLRCHGLACELHRLTAEGAREADLIHDFAARTKTDLLVTGGFGHSRLREVLFGGVTCELIQHALLPVMLSR